MTNREKLNMLSEGHKSNWVDEAKKRKEIKRIRMTNDISPESELLQVGSSLVRVQLSEFWEDWKFSKSTPKKDIRMVLTAIKKHNDFQRRTAIRVKDIYDKLTKNR